MLVILYAVRWQLVMFQSSELGCTWGFLLTFITPQETLHNIDRNRAGCCQARYKSCLLVQQHAGAVNDRPANGPAGIMCGRLQSARASAHEIVKSDEHPPLRASGPK